MLELSLAIRHLLPGFSIERIFPLLATLSVAVAVCTISTVQGVMRGFEEELREKLLNINPHILIQPLPKREQRQKIEKISEVFYAAPFSQRQVLIFSTFGKSAALLRTLPLEAMKMMKGMFLPSSFVEGELIMGAALAKALGVREGDSVMLSTGFSMRSARIAALYKCGVHDYEMGLLFSCKVQKPSGLLLWLKDVYKAERVCKKIKSIAPGCNTRSWIQMNKALFDALRLERMVAVVVLSNFLLLSALCVASVLWMNVLRRTKEIATLEAIGLTKRRLKRIFLMEGALIGGVGIAVGLFATFLLKHFFFQREFIRLPQNIYFVEKIPMNLCMQDLFFVAMGAILLSVVASILSAHKAASINCAQALRYG